MHFILSKDKRWWISVVKAKMQTKNLATRSTFYVCSIKIFLYNRPMVQWPNILLNSAKAPKQFIFFFFFFFLISICVENTVACMCVLLSSACTAALWHHPVSQHGFSVILQRWYLQEQRTLPGTNNTKKTSETGEWIRTQWSKWCQNLQLTIQQQHIFLYLEAHYDIMASDYMTSSYFYQY